MNAKVAILASGEGTTTEAFIVACAKGEVAAEPVLVICNKESAGIFKRVEMCNQKYGFQTKTALINAKNYPVTDNEVLIPGGQTKAEEAEILKLLSDNNIDLVLLLGYLRRVGPKLVHEYGWRSSYISPYDARMLNTHPGLLPSTKGYYGLHVQEYILQMGLVEAGQTLHVVSENYDEGPIIKENKVEVLPNDTPDSLFDRVRETERRCVPIDVQDFIANRNRYLKERS